MVIDSTDINRLHLAEQELHQMMESDVSGLGRGKSTKLISAILNLHIAITKRQLTCARKQTRCKGVSRSSQGI